VAFAGRLTSVLRASDTAARLGGDEFAIVCENTERTEGEVLADRVRTTVTDRLVLGELTMTIGMSIGIGSAAGGAEPDEVYDQVVREADDAMYADKAGRRR
jgi:diguanylate cyclase (GGDEF)-like protein